MSFGDYISGLIKESFMTAPYGGGYEDHLRNWTLYYWAWWIAWAPFSGSFIARISRGRTIPRVHRRRPHRPRARKPHLVRHLRNLRA